MIVISYAIVMENSTQSIFSTGRRASRNLLEICYKQLNDLGLASWADTLVFFLFFLIKKIRFNVEQLFLKNPFTGKISKIFSYPSNPKINTIPLTNPLYPFFPRELLTIIHIINIYFLEKTKEE
jgi:hypothetical protein